MFISAGFMPANRYSLDSFGRRLEADVKSKSVVLMALYSMLYRGPPSGIRIGPRRDLAIGVNKNSNHPALEASIHGAW